MLGNKVKFTLSGEKSSGHTAPESDARKLDRSIETFQNFERTPVEAVVTVKQCSKDADVFNRLLTETNHQWKPGQIQTINRLDAECRNIFDVNSRNHELFEQRVQQMKEDLRAERAAAAKYNSTKSR